MRSFADLDRHSVLFRRALVATFALDYDGTYTADPELWDSFISACKIRGHRVVVVTARRRTEENLEIVRGPDAAIYFTELAAKKWYMDKIGVKVDIWIDDDPSVIINGH